MLHHQENMATSEEATHGPLGTHQPQLKVPYLSASHSVNAPLPGTEVLVTWIVWGRCQQWLTVHRVDWSMGLIPLALNDFKDFFTLFPKCFSSFVHTTCSLSVLVQYLAFGEIHLRFAQHYQTARLMEPER